MPLLDPRQKAERLVELFRSRRPTEILPAEVYPASLEEAYAIRRCFQEIEEATGRLAFCIMSLRVIVRGQPKSFCDGGEGKPSANSATKSRAIDPKRR